jgi:hypothetical protein
VLGASSFHGGIVNYIESLRFFAKIASLVAGGVAIFGLCMAVQRWNLPKHDDLLMHSGIAGAGAVLLVLCANALPHLPKRRGRRAIDRFLNFIDAL